MKKRQFVAGLLALAALLTPCRLHAKPDTLQHYSKEHKLLYEDSWDLWPYVFLDEQGRPKGFNIDLLRLLLKELDIPEDCCEIKLKPAEVVRSDLRNNHFHLTFRQDMGQPAGNYLYSKNVIMIFANSVLTPKSQPVTVRTINDLANNPVMVHEGSYCHYVMKERGWEANALPYSDMREAVMQLSSNEEGQLVWNTASLKWLLKITHTNNLQLTPVNMLRGEYKMLCSDTNLLTRLDSAYTALRVSGRIEPLFDKWIYPEHPTSGIPSWIWYLTGLAALAVLILIYYNVRYHSIERKVLGLISRTNNRLTLILQASHVRILTYEVATQTFTVMDHNIQPQRRYCNLEFAQRFRTDDFLRLWNALSDIVSGNSKRTTLELSRYDEEHNGELRDFKLVLTVLRKKNGKPAVIMLMRCDVTEEHRKQHEAQSKLFRYESVFNTAMVDMVYFDENGNVANLNKRAEQTFKSTREQAVVKKINIEDCLGEKEFSIKHFDYFYATQIEGNKYGKKYYERQLVPVFNQQNKLLGIYGTGRDVTEVVNAYHEMLKGSDKVQQAINELTDYVRNINYVLGVGGVRMANYSPNTHTLTIYKGLDDVQLKLTQSRCMTLVDERWQKMAMRTLNNMDNRTVNTIDAEIKTTLHTRSGNRRIPLYLQLRFIPAYDDEGQVDSYFGLCRDLSIIKDTERLLEKETQRAQEVENLKNSFLRNMSYEIRTPLNTVVGFAELFEKEHAMEDEDIFIKEIKDNSAHLLRLINDILFLSRLDAHMIEINKQPTDFAMTFDAHCQMAWANSMRDGVNYEAENHYNHLIIDIDDTNIGRIIEQVIANSVQHTEQGTVRARYDYIGDKLMIAIEDTGCGMSAETLNNIYERFSSNNHSNQTGTGLGLPICKELATQMGGTINITSELGKGTTVWVVMPCKATVIDRKKNL